LQEARQLERVLERARALKQRQEALWALAQALKPQLEALWALEQALEPWLGALWVLARERERKAQERLRVEWRALGPGRAWRREREDQPPHWRQKKRKR
jgi:hypothetical protein